MEIDFTVMIIIASSGALLAITALLHGHFKNHPYFKDEK